MGQVLNGPNQCVYPPQAAATMTMTIMTTKVVTCDNGHGGGGDDNNYHGSGGNNDLDSGIDGHDCDDHRLVEIFQRVIIEIFIDLFVVWLIF